MQPNFEAIDVETLYKIVHEHCYHETNPDTRHQLGKIFADIINKHFAFSFEALSDSPLKIALVQLKKVGICDPIRLLSTLQAKEVYDYFADLPAYPRHHPYDEANGTPPLIDQDEVKQISNFGSFGIEQVVKAPHLLEVALNEQILSFMQSYLGCTPTLYSIHVFFSYPTASPPTGPQDFHRDMEAYNSCALMLCLSDMTEENGPHVYLKNTFDLQSTQKCIQNDQPSEDILALALKTFKTTPPDGYGQADLYLKLFEDQLVRAHGQAGEAFFINPYGLHMGERPTEQPRLMCWLRYGAMPTEKAPPFNIELPSNQLLFERMPCLADMKNEKLRYLVRYFLTS